MEKYNRKKENEKEKKNLKNKIDSKIITKKEELDFISNRLKKTEQFKK